ncbi:MAG: hypothetical protein QOF14_2514 [Hyphomicrobiales bacterium]|jgi:hypothetical protein|nr:hypothetical protein [Hyphomicrobiales bacterium]
MITRRGSLRALAGLGVLPLSGCGTWISRGDIKDGVLAGHVVVEWYREDKFIYRKQAFNTFSFKPSFLKNPIVPGDMYTDGGSVPRIFWNIPGLSPWALGPAYIIHDWIFEVHRCGRAAPPEIKAITFEQSALILGEVGKALIDHGLIDHDLLDPILWAVSTRFARDLWDTPGKGCQIPPPAASRAFLAATTGRRVIDFVIPPRRR